MLPDFFQVCVAFFLDGSIFLFDIKMDCKTDFFNYKMDCNLDIR